MPHVKQFVYEHVARLPRNSIVYAQAAFTIILDLRESDEGVTETRPRLHGLSMEMVNMVVATLLSPPLLFLSRELFGIKAGNKDVH